MTIRKLKNMRVMSASIPFLLIFILATIWGIAAFSIGVNINFQESLMVKVVTRLIPLLIGLSVVMIPSALFASYYFHSRIKQEEWNDNEYDTRSGKGKESIIPDEIKGWNWGGFFIGLIWGPRFGIWRSLILLIPLVNLVYIFALGLSGNELAWQNNKWRSVKEFKKVMKSWNITGVSIWVLLILLKIVFGM